MIDLPNDAADKEIAVCFTSPYNAHGTYYIPMISLTAKWIFCINFYAKYRSCHILPDHMRLWISDAVFKELLSHRQR